MAARQSTAGAIAVAAARAAALERSSNAAVQKGAGAASSLGGGALPAAMQQQQQQRGKGRTEIVGRREALRALREQAYPEGHQPWLGDRAVTRETTRLGRVYVVAAGTAAAAPVAAAEDDTRIVPPSGAAADPFAASAEALLAADDEAELRVPSVTTVNSVLAKPFLGPWQTRTAVKFFADSVKRDQRLLANYCRLDGVRASHALRDWAKATELLATKAPDSVRDEAAGLGEQAHDLLDTEVALEVAAAGGEPGLSSEASGYERGMPFEVRNVVEGFRMWRKDTRAELELLRGETMCYSAKHGYAGELDALARDRQTGKLVILDWKTSNSLHNDYALQLAAYAEAVKEITGEDVEAAWVVRFGKFKPSYEARRVADLTTSFENFRAALQLYNLHTSRMAPDHWSAVRSATKVATRQ